jgi:hypothetical protein
VPQSYWSTIAHADSRMGQTKKGKPILNVKTSNGKTLALLGAYDMLAKIVPGTEVQHSEPFGDKPFATVEFIEPPVQGFNPPPPGPSAYPPKATPPPAANPPENPILGGLPQAKNSNGAPTWEEFKHMFHAAHCLAAQYEPDLPAPKNSNEQHIDRSLARVAIVQSILVAFREGKQQAPQQIAHIDADSRAIPGADAPMPDDEPGFPWENAS